MERPRTAEVCVVARLPDSIELGYCSRPPRRGQRVQSHSGKMWFVSDVLQSGLNTYTVVCSGPDVFLGILRGPNSREDLAWELLSPARKPIRLQAEKGRDKRRRGVLPPNNDWIEKYLGMGPEAEHAGAPSRARNSSELGAHPSSDEWLETYLQRGRIVKLREATDRPSSPRLRLQHLVEITASLAKRRDYHPTR
jgi:hypothetical protein